MKLKPLNLWQQAAAPKHSEDVSEEGISSLKVAMLNEGVKSVPVFTDIDRESGQVAKTWRDKNSGRWIYAVTFPDQSTARFESDTYDGLSEEVAEFNTANAEQLAEATERGKIVAEWIANYKFGKQYELLTSYLSDARAHEANGIVQDFGRSLYGSGYWTSPERLEESYIKALDSGALDEFEAEAVANRKQEIWESNQQTEQERLQSEQEAERAAANRQNTEAIDLATARILAKSPEGMQRLRRKAIPKLSGQQVETVPSTGSNRRF